MLREQNSTKSTAKADISRNRKADEICQKVKEEHLNCTSPPLSRSSPDDAGRNTRRNNEYSRFVSNCTNCRGVENPLRHVLIRFSNKATLSY